MSSKSRLFSTMEWTKDNKTGYESFDDCYADWEEKAEKDPSINLLDIFKIDEAVLNRFPGTGRRGGRRGRGGRKDGT